MQKCVSSNKLIMVFLLLVHYLSPFMRVGLKNTGFLSDLFPAIAPGPSTILGT